MFQNLDNKTIGDLDEGTAGKIIDAAIREAVRDFDDRAAQDKKPRKVCIELTIDPRENGEAEISVEAHAKIPKRRTPSTVARLRAAGGEPQLQFNDMDKDDPNQTTIDMHMGKKRRKAESEGDE